MRIQRDRWMSYATMGLLGGAVFGLVVVGAAAVYLVFLSPPPGPQPTPIPTPSPPAALGAISGRVWHDLCAVGGGRAESPLLPSEGCIESGEGGYVANGVFDPGEPPLAGADLHLGYGACPSPPTASSQTLGDGTFVFTNLSPGSYCLSINAETQPLMQLIPGRWTYPAGQADPTFAEVSIELGPGEVRTGLDFGWDYALLPVPEPEPEPSPAPTPTTAACTDAATFVSDVSIPDGTWVTAGASFDKTWRLRNAGTCTWTSNYAVAFVSGQSLGASVPTPLSGSVVPGATVDLTLRLTAPLTPGSYRGNWMLRNPSGAFFGVGRDAATAFWTLINVGDPTSPTAAWRGEYFDNRNLSGSPDMVRQDARVEFDWGNGSPASSISADNFSVRWTAKIAFQGGTYDFRLLVDDGARLYIDGNLVIDEWEDGASRELAASVPLVKGDHTIRLEYFERSGQARVRLGWTRLTSFPDWKGEYFTNRDLSGTPSLVRNDKEVRFDWGTGAPASGLPNDGFSVRWTTKITFEAGRYRLYATADDGVRVYIDGALVLNEWHDSSGGTVYTVKRDLATKTDVVVEYYERSGRASVRFWYERIGTATATVSPTASQTATITVTETASATATASTTASATPSETPTPSSTPTPSETPTITPTPTATCEPIECGPLVP